MKLKRIRLLNYRRHRDTELEFPDGVTSLLGPNGSGKSTLLEAIGFALYGSRATRGPKEHLRHDRAAPADAVRVELDFEAAGQAIQIVRELRGQALSGKASLIVDGQTLVAPQAGSDDAATKAVSKLLGMGRETFFATVVAKQNELAALGDMKPAARKQFLLEMLGIDALDAAIQQARQQRRDLEVELETLRAHAPDAAALRGELEAAQARAQAIQLAMAKAQATWQTAQATCTQARQALASAQSTMQLQERTEQERKVVAHELAATLQRREAAQTELLACRQAAKDAASLGPVAEDLARAEAALEAARRQQEAAQAAARAAAARRAAEQDEQEATRQLRAIPKREAPDASALEAQEQTARQALQTARDARAQAQARLDGAIQQQRAVLELEDAPCPTCTRPLGQHASEVHEHVAAAVALAQTSLDETSAEQARSQSALEEASARLGAARRDLETWRAEQTERRHLEARLARAQDVLRDLGPTPDAREAPDVVPLEAALAEARQRHTQYTRLRTLAEAEARWQKTCSELDADIQRHQHRLKELGESLAHEPDARPALQAAQDAADAANAAEREAERAWLETQSDARLQQQALEGLERRVKEAKEAADRVRELRGDLDHWSALTTRRNDGVLDRFRAHMVQRIGPSISAEASRLLEAFTGGRYRELRLDADYEAYVSDGGVQYPVGRFSGGETDVIHLALRLAVSRLLVERGGTDIRLLALDEVFGSLDDQRREDVLATLNGLDRMYSQVLLITHQEGLRDALDQVITVREEDGEAVVTRHNG